MQNSSLNELLENYQVLFSYLSEVFLNEPDEAFIQHIIDNELFFSFPFQSESPDLQKGLSLLKNFALQWESPQVYALRDEYLRLFHGAGKMLVPPYESVYLSIDHLLFEKETLAVRDFYSRYGLRIDQLNIIPDDHIGYQLLFIAWLLKRSLEASGQNDPGNFKRILKDLKEFSDSHLLKWSGSFLELLEKHAVAFYYRGNAHLLKFMLTEFKKDLEF
jgi:putative dimethyl sulfoxide reductase chaperone